MIYEGWRARHGRKGRQNRDPKIAFLRKVATTLGSRYSMGGRMKQGRFLTKPVTLAPVRFKNPVD